MKKWATPKLIVLIAGKQGESGILHSCKTGPGGIASGPGDAYSYCHWEGDEGKHSCFAHCKYYSKS